jgi:hypothetical protein
MRGDAAAGRFVNDYTCLQHFNSAVLLSCPRCRQCAELVPSTSKPRKATRPIIRQALCRHCGYCSQFESATFDHACVATDWHRRLPLWLQVPCCGRVLWAFNEDHLSFLRQFIQARLRERARDPRHSNHSMTSRLPQWMQAAKHRDEVLRGLDRLTELLPVRQPKSGHASDANIESPSIR